MLNGRGKIAILWVCLVLAGCDSPFVEDFKSVFDVVEAVSELTGTEGVQVTIRNGLEMSIVVADAPINSAAADDRRELAAHVASLGVEHFAHADELQAISVELIATERKYLIVTFRTTIDFFRFTGQRLADLHRSARQSERLPNEADGS